jgi:uncharacterized protein (DUF111 family)
MRVAYVDLIGGAAGDMLMGAWVDAGLDAGALERALRGVVAEGWELVTEPVVRGGIEATYLDLVIPGEDHHAHDAHGNHVHGGGGGRTLREILAIVARSGLTPRQIERASAVYRRLAAADARAQGGPLDDVVFHRVGQIDAILDVAGTCIALDLLEIDELFCSAFPAGRGNPDLLRGFPQRPVDIDAQLVTVTGAAILTTLVAAPGTPVEMTVERSGYGAGRSEFPFPNVTRVLIGSARDPIPSA